MSVREYVGARYVPIVVGEWDNTKTYEPLMVVIHEGNSYTSRQYVPVGIEITNESYWTLSANYNAQVEAYRQEVRDILPYDEIPTEGSTKGATSNGIWKAITAETTRATAAEKVNADAITAIDAKFGTMPFVLVDDFYAQGDADYTNAFNAAFATGKRVVATPEKTYNIGRVDIGIADYTYFDGNCCTLNFIDTDMSKWDVSTQRLSNCMLHTGEFNNHNPNQIVVIKNANFNFNAASFTNVPTALNTNGFGLGFYDCHSVTIDSCSFKNSFESAIYYCNIDMFNLTNCEFEDISIAQTIPSGTSRNCVECGQNLLGITQTATDVYCVNCIATNVNDEFMRCDSYNTVYCENIVMNKSATREKGSASIVENHNYDAGTVKTKNSVTLVGCKNYCGNLCSSFGPNNTVNIIGCYNYNDGKIDDSALVIGAVEGGTTNIISTIFEGEPHNAFYLSNGGTVNMTNSSIDYADAGGGQLTSGGIFVFNNCKIDQKFKEPYLPKSVTAVNTSLANVVACNIDLNNCEITDRIVSKNTDTYTPEYVHVKDCNAAGITIGKDCDILIANSRFGSEYSSLPSTPTKTVFIHDVYSTANYSGVAVNLSNVKSAFIHDNYFNFNSFKGAASSKVKVHDNSFELQASE